MATNVSLKAEWDSAKKDVFLAKLSYNDWREIRENVFEKNQKRIEVDNYGLWLWEADGSGKWVRTHGLSDDNIDAYKGNLLKFTEHLPDGKDQLVSFMLKSVEWVYKQ